MSKKIENEEEEIKVILIGDSRVGKTNLINTMLIYLLIQLKT